VEKDLVYLKGVDVPCAKPIDSLTDPFDEFGEPGLVIRRDRFACLFPLGVGGHQARLAAQTERACCYDRSVLPPPISGMSARLL
jgi:hypothetical protein